MVEKNVITSCTICVNNKQYNQVWVTVFYLGKTSVMSASMSVIVIHSMQLQQRLYLATLPPAWVIIAVKSKTLFAQLSNSICQAIRFHNRIGTKSYLYTYSLNELHELVDLHTYKNNDANILPLNSHESSKRAKVEHATGEQRITFCRKPIQS